MEKASGSEVKGQGPDEVQVLVLAPQEEPPFKDSGQKPSHGHNPGFSPVLMARGQGSCLVGSDARNQGPDLEEGHGAQPPTLHRHVLAHQAEAHNAALCVSWLSAQAACLGQPWPAGGASLKARNARLGREGVSCSVLQGPRPGATQKTPGLALLLPWTLGILGPQGGGAGVEAASREWATAAEAWSSVPLLAGPAGRPGTTRPAQPALWASDRASWS